MPFESETFDFIICQGAFSATARKWPSQRRHLRGPLLASLAGRYRTGLSVGTRACCGRLADENAKALNFQNFSEPVRALQEMRRVLKVGGTALLIDLRRDVPNRAINEHVKNVSTSMINWLTNQLVFRLVLAKRAYTKDQLKEFMAASSFLHFEIREGPMFLETWAERAVD